MVGIRKGSGWDQGGGELEGTIAELEITVKLLLGCAIKYKL